MTTEREPAEKMNPVEAYVGISHDNKSGLDRYVYKIEAPGVGFFIFEMYMRGGEFFILRSELRKK